MQDEKNDASSFAGFELGAPALVCRWRLASRTLPLENRHLRALAARSVNAGIARPEDARRGLYLLDQVYELMYQVAKK